MFNSQIKQMELMRDGEFDIKLIKQQSSSSNSRLKGRNKHLTFNIQDPKRRKIHLNLLFLTFSLIKDSISGYHGETLETCCFFIFGKFDGNNENSKQH